MDVDLFGGTPFHSVGETVSTLDGGQRGQPISEEGPPAAFWGGRLARHASIGGQTRIVMSLAVVDQGARTTAGPEVMVQIPADAQGTVVLEELAVGPLHSPFRQAGFRGIPRPT